MQDAKHLVFGAGLIGGYMAGAITLAGLNCAMVARPAVREALSDELLLSDYLGNEGSIPSPTFADPEASCEYDYLWLTVKCTAVESVLEELAGYVGPQITIVCCQNGLGSDAQLRDRFTDVRVIQAVFGSNVAQPASNRLHRSTEGTLVIEDDGRGDVPDLAKRLNSGLMPTRSSREFRAEQWAKLQLNLANAVNALSDVPVKTMLEQRGLRKLIAALMKEMLVVTDSKDIALPQLAPLPPHWIPRLLDVPDWLFALLGKKMLAIDPTARASMWWDLHNGKKTEVDYLNAAVVREAVAEGLAAPVNQRLVELVRQVETGAQSRDWTPAELAGRLFSEP
ncbi:2-dehydropantoate 2-reductase [Congregibacter sp.]|uniref:2-dehydropantoate 2-reductase n=1 Tax=Congregibacter sp. TaxID=2744308 RepID=UPI003F6ADE37